MANDFDLNALYLALDAERIRRHLTWTGVAKDIEQRFIKVSASTIKGVASRPRVEGDGILQMCLWLDTAPETFVSGYAGVATPLRPAAPGTILRWDAAKMYSLLDAQRDKKGLTWQEMAAEITGVTAQQLKRLSEGGRVFLPDIMRVVRWLGISVTDLTKESTY